MEFKACNNRKTLTDFLSESNRIVHYMRIPEIVGNVWFGSKPFTKEDLKGKVILVDFWTYSCVNCLRTIPYLKMWWEEYKDKGFLIIGIHTPEFDFEKDPKNVEKAIKELGIGWPVVMDNNYTNWNNFANHYWPAKYLVDKNAKIVYEHFGEGAYEEIEQRIRSLLGLKTGEEKALEIGEHKHAKVCFIATPEIYCGYLRGRIDNKEGYQKDVVAQYTSPEVLQEDSIALSGSFLATSEFVESQDPTSTLILCFHATEVNLVLAPQGTKITIEVFFNEQPLGQEIMGKDVEERERITVTTERLYNLLKSRQPLSGVLEIRAEEGNFRAYAFTFSGCS